MKEEIRKEIEDIAPTLVAVGNDTPYAVPEGYFESLVAGLEVSSADRDEQGPSATYFNGLHQRVMDQIAKDKSPKVMSMHPRWWMAAASIASLVMASIWMMGADDDKADQDFAQEIQIEESIDYLVSTGDIYTAELIELIDEEALDDYDLEIDEAEDIEDILSRADLELLEELL